MMLSDKKKFDIKHLELIMHQVNLGGKWTDGKNRMLINTIKDNQR